MCWPTSPWAASGRKDGRGGSPGRAKLAGRFPELEAQLAGLTYGGGYEGPGRSPDRADDEQVATSPGCG
jgi:hypothetical protein